MNNGQFGRIVRLISCILNFDPLFTPGSSKENVLVMVETVAGRSEVHCWGIACEDRAVIEKSRGECWAVMD